MKQSQRSTTGSIGGVERWGIGIAFALLAAACSDPDTRRLDPALVGMTDDLAPIYDDGELQIYEVRSSIELPILRPDDEDRRALNQTNVEPFGRYPWVTPEDVEVQVTWSLTNLDAEAHSVSVLIDPWNEFGRYWPGMQVVDEDDGELAPNLSGIEELHLVEGVGAGDDSRLHGTFSISDMQELAIDFATVMKMLVQVQPTEEGDPRVTYANHAFNVLNRSYDSPLVDRYRPEVIPGLVGFDFGLRSFEPMNVALEIAVEVFDRDGHRVAEEDSDDPLMRMPQEYVTAGQ